MSLDPASAIFSRRAAAVLLVLASCACAAEEERTREASSSVLVCTSSAAAPVDDGGDPAPGSDSDVYPVDPRAHVEDAANDPLAPGSFRPTISNAAAYARYGASTIAGRAIVGADAIAETLAAAAESSGVSPDALLSAYATPSSAAADAAFLAASLRGARGVEPGATLSATGRRIVQLGLAVDACAARAAGGRQACCEALALPTFVLEAWSSLGLDEQAALADAAATPGFYRALAARAAGGDRFRQQGIKAWLSVCAAPLRRAPTTLEALHARYGDPRAGAGWDAELHPISMAKMGGRRVHRSSAVSIAESLDEDCAVRETEVVIPRADGELDFWTYDASGVLVPYGHFPAGQGADAVKYVPDACMGCHYTFDARRFSVRAPSYRALQLRPRCAAGEPDWRDQSACAEKGERVVYDYRPE